MADVKKEYVLHCADICLETDVQICVGIMALKLTTPRHWIAIIVELDIKLSLRQL
jgi:hypothetical protein